MGLSHKEIKRRDEKIIDLYRMGGDIKKIASLFQLTGGRVYQIIWRHTKK